MNDDRRTRVFHELVWPLRADVLRIALILTGNSSDADDLAQDTLLKAFRAMHRFDGVDVKAWLMTILRNTRIDRLRTAAARGLSVQVSLDTVESDEGGLLAPVDDPDSAATALHPQDILEAFSDEELIDALQGLPEEIRWSLLLVDVEGRPQNEVAVALEVPVGTIKSRVHRGRAMLRAALLPLARDRRLVRDGERQR